LSYDNDFDEIADDLDFFSSKLMKRFYAEIDEMFKEIKNGKLKGTLETREINEPGVKGYIIQGRFDSDEAHEPFEPLKPLRRRPLPEKPFELSKDASKETREPLTDVFEEESATKIYVELPGEEKEDIQLKVTENGIEVNAENFHKMIELPDRRLNKQGMALKYRNGVLEITVPKQTGLWKKKAGRERLV